MSTLPNTEAINTICHETEKTLPVCSVRTIFKEYFLLKIQRVNIHIQTTDPDWLSLKKGGV